MKGFVYGILLISAFAIAQTGCRSCSCSSDAKSVKQKPEPAVQQAAAMEAVDPAPAPPSELDSAPVVRLAQPIESVLVR